MTPTKEELDRLVESKYFNKPRVGWGPVLRKKFDYVTPEDYYECLLNKLIKDGWVWADVGCGRRLLSRNPELARELAQRAALVVGIDPDENIKDNEFIDEAFQGTLQEFEAVRRFDLVTMRMVAEHVEDPDSLCAKLEHVVKPGGLVVVYTPNRFAPSSIVAALTPMSFHHAAKRILWDTDTRDTFPVVYKMNTRNVMKCYFEKYKFAEKLFVYLEDCRSTNRVRILNTIELAAIKAFKKIGLIYPENCLLAVFRREA